MVEPVDPFERGVFDRFEVAPWSPPVDHLGPVKAIDHLGQSVAIAVADTADGRLDARFGEPFGVLDRDILAAAIGVMDETAAVRRSAIMERLFQCVEHEACVSSPARLRALGLEVIAIIPTLGMEPPNIACLSEPRGQGRVFRVGRDTERQRHRVEQDRPKMRRLNQQQVGLR